MSPYSSLNSPMWALAFQGLGEPGGEHRYPLLRPSSRDPSSQSWGAPGPQPSSPPLQPHSDAHPVTLPVSHLHRLLMSRRDGHGMRSASQGPETQLVPRENLGGCPQGLTASLSRALSAAIHVVGECHTDGTWGHRRAGSPVCKTGLPGKNLSASR